MNGAAHSHPIVVPVRRAERRLLDRLSPSSPLPALVVLILGLCLTGVAVTLVDRTLARRDEVRFQSRANALIDRIAGRLDDYRDALIQTKAFITVTPDLDDARFAGFFRQTRLVERHPGIQGVGWAERVTGDRERERLVQRRREEGEETFHVWPVTAGDEFPITYLEPLDWRNRRALGYDMFSEPTRHRAMVRARDTGQPAATARVTLVQETEVAKQPGFLLYAPEYTHGADADPDDMRGFVYAPFRTHDLFSAIRAGEPELSAEVSFRVYDGPEPVPEELVFDAAGTVPAPAPGRAFHRHLAFAGTTWTVECVPTPGLAAPADRTYLPSFTGVFGLAVSLVAFLVVTVMHRRSEVERLVRAQEASAFIESILSTTPALIVVLDAEGRILFFSRHAEQVTGWRARDVLGRSWAELFVPPEERARVEEVFARVCRGEGGDRFENEIVTRTGERRCVAWSNTRLTDARGALQYVIAAGSDETDRLAAEAERARLLAKPQQDVEDLRIERDLREKFVTTLSHDLRNPLGIARVCAQQLARSVEDHHGRSVERIIGSLDRANKMIQDLLDANRLRAGHRLPMLVEFFDLALLLKETAEELALVTGPRLVVRAPATLDGYWSRDAVRRIAENLVTNAVKYGAPERPITLTLEDRGERIVLGVHNEGNPISPDALATLFQPFHRTTDAVKSGRIGWGIGLTLVRGLAEAMGGEVYVESSEAAGTTFSVLLPRDARPFVP